MAKQAITTSAMPLESGDIFECTQKQSFLPRRPSTTRPLSEATEIFDTDFEDSEFEEECSPKSSFDTDDRRRSQTTISSYDEAPTPRSTQSQQQAFEIRFRPVEGPKGPHLFRCSQASSEYSFDYALQMSPLFPKKPPPRTESALSEDTVAPVTQQREADPTIETALAQTEMDSLDCLEGIRTWSPQQVVDWAYTNGIDDSVVESFVVHDVDGKLLLDLQFDDLKELDIQSFGKRHQVWNAICDLKGEERRPSPQPTPFEDISRPCTTNARRSPSQPRDACRTPIDGASTPIDGLAGKKRRGRKAAKHLDVITPAESVSIVAIEQLLPKPHKCAKGERCAKWRKQQREIQQLHQENGIGRFPVSPSKGGRIFVHGDPGNATTAENMIPNVRMQPGSRQQTVPESPFGIPSVVASSDLLGPGQLPEFALHADMLQQLEKRDPQDNVKQFLDFQHMHSPGLPLDDHLPPGSPAAEPRHRPDLFQRSATVPPPVLFPELHFQAYPSLQSQTYAPRQNLRSLPRLEIPRAATAGPNLNSATALTIPQSAVSAASICRAATASPGTQQQIMRLASPASEIDIPMTAFPLGAIERETSASVPPNFQHRPQNSRSHSRAADWRRPTPALPAVKENEILSPISDPQTARPSCSSHSSTDGKNSLTSSVEEREKVRDPAHHSPQTKQFGYGSDCTHAGWMKKRKARMLRHEWHNAHFRLKGTELGMYENARLSAAAKETINVDDYAVACSSVASSNKLAAAMKAFHIGNSAEKGVDATAFAFQLVPQAREGEQRKLSARDGKTHHFAVQSKDQRIDWMRELMLAKALQAKGRGFEVEVNGVQA